MSTKHDLANLKGGGGGGGVGGKKEKSGLDFHLIFHRFSPFNCCSSVDLYLDLDGDYAEDLHVAI